jgi:hypothetical protein
MLTTYLRDSRPFGVKPAAPPGRRQVFAFNRKSCEYLPAMTQASSVTMLFPGRRVASTGPTAPYRCAVRRPLPSNSRAELAAIAPARRQDDQR